MVKLSVLCNLIELNISANDIQLLPIGLESLPNLQKINVSNNLMNSKSNASENWEMLASIQNLKELNLSRNQFRGIHTEKLKAGDFLKLEILDFSFNIIDNQYNLICSRNFQSLKTLIISGNPFAVHNQYKGLEMEVVARTGALVITDQVEKKYLKKPNQNIKNNIAFGNILKL